MPQGSNRGPTAPWPWRPFGGTKPRRPPSSKPAPAKRYATEGIQVPTVALIQGQCFDGAFEQCLACDLIWAAEGGGAVFPFHQ